MRQPREARTEVEWTLPVTIGRVGHDPPIPRGTVVRCLYDHVHLYDELETERERLHPYPADRQVMMQDAGVGIVIDVAWHVEWLDLARAMNIRFCSSTHRHHLRDVNQEMWYYVAFRKGLFWARWNWLEVVTDPPPDAEELRKKALRCR